MKANSWRSPTSVRVRRVRSPALEGAAPANRASERNVLDVPTANSYGPALRTCRATGARVGVQFSGQRVDVARGSVGRR